MKKLFLILSLAGLLSLTTTAVYAQAFDSETQIENTAPLHQVLKEKYIEGGVLWMSPLLLFLVIGLAVIIERILYLNFATTNTKKLLASVDEALNSEGVDAAKEVCRNTRGPVASIFYQGLEHYDEGMDVVERSVVSYGSVQMGLLESGLNWVSLFIAIAPMVGFMGTVVGMIVAFDQIEAAGDISPTMVAGGIKIALLTTMMGLIAAVILQIFYNYILVKIDSLVISMEDASISLVDMLSKYNKNK